VRFVRIVTVLAIAAAHVLGANIVTNGSFETPTVASGNFAFFPSISGWTLASGPSIEIQNNYLGAAFAGQQLVELDSQSNSGIFQDLSTIVGPYTFSFAYSPRPGWAENPVQVFWNGALLDTVNASGAGLTNTSWVVRSYNVTASAATTRIQFNAIGTSDSFGGFLDNVSVDNVPEPASAVLCGIGVAALLACQRKPVRQNS